jgi:hypothetical protein
MFKLGHTITWTLKKLQVEVQRIEGDKNIWSHSSFFHRKGRNSQPVNSVSSIWVAFCTAVHKLKQVGPLKSGISLLAWVHRRFMMYEELMFELVLVFELTLTTESE